MKVVQINAVYNISSTGKNVTELHSTLLNKGFDSYVVYSESDKFDDPNLYHIGSKFDVKMHALLARITGLQGYYSKRATKKLLKYFDEIKPDVVHLNNLHGNFVNIPMLLKYLAKNDTATVVTMHDYWFITGKCVHYINKKCNKWKSTCHNCPNLKDSIPSWFFDRTQKLHNEKKELFANIPRLAFTGVSQWVVDETKKSVISDGTIVKKIYNWISLDNFYQCDSTGFKKEKGFEDKFVVLGVSGGWNEKKGLNDFVNLARKRPDYAVVLVGNTPNIDNKPDNLITVGSTSSVQELRNYYNMADALACFSPAETFGKVSAEALACGTPLVVYNATANPELVGDGCGYVVDFADLDSAIEVFEKIRLNKKESYSKSCIDFAKNNFEQSKLLDEYISLYNEVYESAPRKKEKTIFLGGIYPEEKIDELRKTEYLANIISSDTLQKNIIKGLEKNLGKHVPVFNLYFLRDKKQFKRVKKYNWECEDGCINYNLPYVRLKGYSLFSKYFSVKKYVSKWIQENNPDGKTKVVVYPAYFPFLMALNRIKKKHDIEVCMVVADLPQFMGLQAVKTLYNKVSLKFTMYLFNKNLPVVDSFVLLTEYMNEFVNKDNKPYRVMEGIASELYEYKALPVDKSPRTVIYSGGMQEKYGIPVLLDAIKLIEDTDVEFRFYGIGDCVELVKERAAKDSRIKHFESLEVNKLHDEQQKSTMLINPRQNNEEYTKYSFPSKNLEYMLSGRPAICYMLDGMGEEYKDYLIIPKDNSVEALANEIKSVLNKTDEEQSEIGMKARNFVLENKNASRQTQKIIDLLSK